MAKYALKKTDKKKEELGMKRMVCLLLAALFLLPLLALAEDDALFPAKDDETGKWGYINRSGEWVIPPQYDRTFDFRGNYAIAILNPDDFEADRWWDSDIEGIIDREGNWVLPPEYSFDAGYDGSYYGGKDTGIWLVCKYKDLIWGVDEDGEEILLQDTLSGFFDIPSGYFSGLKWRQVWHWCSDSALIPVYGEDYRVGYADRTTGELVIPCEYYSVDPSCFYEGVASVAYMDEEYMPSEFFLIDETGAEIPLPDHLMVDYGFDASEGLITALDRETELYGFVDLQGNLVIEPQFTRAEDFEDGYSAVLFPEGDWGYIDREGNVVSRGIVNDSDWWGPDRDNGVYVLQTGENEWTAYAVTGESLFSLQEENLVSLSPPMDNGLCWFATDPSGRKNYWVDRKFGLVDLNGNIVSEAEWKLMDFESRSFPEGLQVVVQIVDGERKLGYLNEQGELALPLIYDSAYNFENGLAWVRIGDQIGYIDHDGNLVFSWSAADGD